MGQFITKVKVKANYDNSLDKNFVFTLITDGTEKDVSDTVNAALRQKIAEGEMSSQNLRGIEIKSDDERGFFNVFVGNVQDLINSV